MSALVAPARRAWPEPELFAGLRGIPRANLSGETLVAIVLMRFWGLFGMAHNLIANPDARSPRVLPIVPATPSARTPALDVAFVLVLIRFFCLGFSPTFLQAAL